MTILVLEKPNYIKDIIIEKDAQDYGKYTIRMNIYGKSKDIVIDDYFPCYKYTVM